MFQLDRTAQRSAPRSPAPAPAASRAARPDPLNQLWFRLATSVPHAGAVTPGAIQRKPTVSTPADPLEREADEAADQVMRMAEPTSLSAAPPTLQRQCATCEDEGKGQKIQRQAGPGAGGERAAVPSMVPGSRGEALEPMGATPRANELQEHAGRKIQSLTTAPQAAMTPDTLFRAATLGPGQAVPYQQDMETAFGERFDNVRAYLGRAGEMRMIGAEAAARGTSVAFRDPHPPRETVAHELAHVVQQRRPEAMSSSGFAALSRPEEPAEREATQVATRAAQGLPVEISQPVGGEITRQTATSPADPDMRPAGPAPEIPASIIAEVEALLDDSEEKPDDSNLTRIGHMAVRVLGPHGVVGAAQEAGVHGAERRERELEGNAGGTIHRQAAEAAAATAGTMWWLTLVDGPLPVGDIIYGALILAAVLAAQQSRIGKGDCYSGRSCDGKILGKKVKHCHNCKNYFSGKSILQPNGTCEKC